MFDEALDMIDKDGGRIAENDSETFREKSPLPVLSLIEPGYGRLATKVFGSRPGEEKSQMNQFTYY